MMPLAMNFDNLHQVLRNLYVEMMPMCGDMIGVAKGVAGLGALFYVAYRVWKALANAEPIDVFPLLRPFAIGLCIMFFPTVVLGTINTVMSPVVQGTHSILQGRRWICGHTNSRKTIWNTKHGYARARRGWWTTKLTIKSSPTSASRTWARSSACGARERGTT